MKIRRIFRRALLPLFLIGIGIAAVFFWALPRFLESDTLQAKLPIGPATWEIRRAGSNGLDAADLRLGPKNRPTLTADALRADYAPSSLLGGRIAAVRLSGVRLFLEWRDGRLVLRSLDELRLPGPESNSAAEAESAPPVSVGRVRIDSGLLHIDGPEGPFLLPFEGALATETDDLSRLSAELTLHPRGQTISLKMQLDRDAQTLNAEMETDGLQLARFADLARTIPGLIPAGRLDLSARLGLNLETFRPTGGRLRLALRGEGPSWRQWTSDSDFRLELESDDGETWHVPELAAALTAPVPLTLTGEKLRIQWSDDRVAVDGTLALRMAPAENPIEDPSSVLQVETPFQWPLAVSGALADGKWTARAELSAPGDDGGESTSWAFRIGTSRLAGRRPDFQLTGGGKLGAGNLATKWTIPALALDFDGTPLRFDRFAGDADIRFGPEEFSAKGTLSGTSASLTAGNTRIDIPDLSVDVSGGTDGGTGTLSLSGGSLGAGGFRMEGVAGRLPLTWPWNATDSAGQISADTLHFDERALGAISGSIRQTDAGIGYRLRHASRLIPGAAVALDGETRFFGTPHETAVSFETRHAIDPPLDMGRFHPAAKGMTLSGNLGVAGRAVVDAAGFRCPADISLAEGHWELAEPPAEARGINLSLPMADLAAPQGRPGGRLRVESLSFGAFRFEAMDVHLQVESSPALLVERAGFSWCGGNVETRAFRIEPGQTEFELLLYADRIHLARFLDQLGTGRAEGEGTVSGRIPVRFEDGTFRFTDGVLFSMPGRGGTLHVTGAEGLASAVGANTPQGAQLDLALAALESFAYDWARLRMNSSGETLSLSLEFNGRPTEPLPFVYKESLGGFVRTAPEGQIKSRFQGIQLNLNLDLPLDDLLRYRGIFDMIQ
ncbi:MAG: YdbH domain-containing protein [Desulfococcaceae bacterium]